MSENSVEPETETAEERAPGATSPAKTTTGTRSGSSGDGVSRRSSKAPAGPGFFARTAQFLRDTRAEMRRVSWPNLLTVRNTTIITLIAVVFFSVYLFLVDQSLAWLIGCDGTPAPPCSGRYGGLNWLLHKLFS